MRREEEGREVQGRRGGEGEGREKEEKGRGG